MDKKLFNLGICSYFLISYFSFQLLMEPWYSSSANMSSFRLFMASIGITMIMLLIGIVCYSKYRKKLTRDPDDSRIIITAQAVKLIGGWIIIAMIMPSFAFVLCMSLGQLNRFSLINIIFLLIFFPFIIIAGVNIRKSFRRDNSQLVSNHVRNLCLIVLSYYLFFSNSYEILKYISRTYPYMTSLSPFDIKWFSTHSVFIVISFILFFIAYKDIKSCDKQYHNDLSSQAFISGGYIILMNGIAEILKLLEGSFDDSIPIVLQSLPAFLLLVIGILFIMIGNKKSATV